MKKVLLINQGHTANLGDILISKVMSGFFLEQGFEIETLPYDDVVQNRFRLPFDKKNILPRLIERIPFVMDYANFKRINNLVKGKKFSFAVIGGGELLASHHGFNSALLMWCRLLEKKNIPVYLYGVSGDTDMSFFYKARYKRALKTCRSISVRDHSTESILRDYYKIKATYYPDVVFSFWHFFKKPQIDKKNRVICIPKQLTDRQLRTLGLRNHVDFYDYLINLVQKSGASNIILTSTEAEDRDAILGFYRYCVNNTHYNIKLIFSPSVEEFINMLAASSCVISCRMHACILGLLNDTDILPVPFKEKLAVFAKEYSDKRYAIKAMEQSYVGLLSIIKDFKELH